MSRTGSRDSSRLRLLLESLSGDLSRPLTPDEIARCLGYYDQVLKWNPLLHLTTLLSPQDFAVRHLGEAFLAEARLLPGVTELWDIGTGAGIPGIPIAIRRPDLTIKLIESNRRKSIYLDEAVNALGLGRVGVMAVRFESLPLPPAGACLTARAVERMASLVGQIIDRGRESSQILLFGNAELESPIRRHLPADWDLGSVLLPSATDRFLYDLRRST